MLIVLETDRLIVRDYTESDIDDLHRLLSDKKTMYYLDDIVTSSIEDTVENLKYVMTNGDGHYFCICLKTSGEYIGSVGYTIASDTPLGRIVHLGYFLLPEHHKHGYAPEAVERVLEFAFLADNCVRVTTGCYKDNDASRKVMEKAGFRKEGERIKAQYHDVVMKDRLEYALNKDEFLMDQMNH